MAAAGESEALAEQLAGSSLAAPPPPPLSERPADPPAAADPADAEVAGAGEQEEAPITLKNGEVSCAYRDLEALPEWIGERHGPRVTRLDLSSNQLEGDGLGSLKLFTALEELVLDGNGTLGDNIVFPAPLPTLESLSMNKCGITNVEPLLEMVKENFPSLQFLSLLGNVACPNELVEKQEADYARYRLLVIYHLPHLQFLDSRPVAAKELAEAKRTGEFLKVVRMTDDEITRQRTKKKKEKSNFTPLPSSSRDPENHRGTIGTCKYVYYGRHSEGNRFIRNNDL